MINTIVLTVHNKRSTIDKIIEGIETTISSLTQCVIIVDDGSSDGTSEILKKYSNENSYVTYYYTPDVWEVAANLIGLAEVKTKYATLIQDDMLIHEHCWDAVLVKSAIYSRAFCVSGRTGCDISFDEDNLYLYNHVGREYPFGSFCFGKIATKILKILPEYSRYKISVMICRALGARKRDTVNRGPLLIDMGMYNKLGGLDGSFSPFELDDVDICLRAQQKGLGDCYVLPVMYSEINGSKKTSSISAEVSRRAINANKMKILKKHSHYITNKSQKRKYIV